MSDHGFWYNSFVVNLSLYKRLNSKLLCDVLGKIYNCGSHQMVWSWLNTYTMKNKPILDCTDDVYLVLEWKLLHHEVSYVTFIQWHQNFFMVPLGSICRYCYVFTYYSLVSHIRLKQVQLTSIGENQWRLNFWPCFMVTSISNNV